MAKKLYYGNFCQGLMNCNGICSQLFEFNDSQYAISMIAFIVDDFHFIEFKLIPDKKSNKYRRNAKTCKLYSLLKQKINEKSEFSTLLQEAFKELRL